MQRKLLKETGLKKCEDLNLSPCRVFQLGKCTLLLVFTPSKAFTIYILPGLYPISQVRHVLQLPQPAVYNTSVGPVRKYSTTLRLTTLSLAYVSRPVTSYLPP